MTDALPEQEEDTARVRLERKHWLALVAAFGVIELAWLISVFN